MNENDETLGFSKTAMARAMTVGYLVFAAANMAVRAIGILPHEVALLALLSCTCAVALYLGDLLWREGDRSSGTIGYLLSAVALVWFVTFALQCEA